MYYSSFNSEGLLKILTASLLEGLQKSVFFLTHRVLVVTPVTSCRRNSASDPSTGTVTHDKSQKSSIVEDHFITLTVASNI
jgi:hypothetical protein